MARRKTQSVEDSMYETFDNACRIESNLMNLLKDYENNRDYDDTYYKIINQLRTIADSKTGMYRNFLMMDELKEFTKIITSIPPEVLEKYIPRNANINPESLIQSAYT